MPTDDEALIRAARDLSNKSFTRRNAAGFASSLADDYIAVTGDGGFLASRAECLKAFQQIIREPAKTAVLFERSPERIEVSIDHLRAAETGRWQGRRSDGSIAVSGTYMAVWRRETDGWKIRCETFVTLA